MSLTFKMDFYVTYLVEPLNLSNCLAMDCIFKEHRVIAVL